MIFGPVEPSTIHEFWSAYRFHVPIPAFIGVPEILLEDWSQLARRLRIVGFVYTNVAPLVAVFVV